MAKFLLGNVVRLRLTVLATDGVTKIAVPVIPETEIPAITLRMQTPDGVVSILPSENLTNPIVGIYDYEYLPVAAGIHRILWVTNGSNAGAIEDNFTVIPTTLI